MSLIIFRYFFKINYFPVIFFVLTCNFQNIRIFFFLIYGTLYIYWSRFKLMFACDNTFFHGKPRLRSLRIQENRTVRFLSSPIIIIFYSAVLSIANREGDRGIRCFIFISMFQTRRNKLASFIPERRLFF